VIERGKTRTRSGRRRKRKGGRAEKKREGEDPINAFGISSIEESEQILVSESLGRELRKQRERKRERQRQRGRREICYG
jgi:hypothetical protein